MTDPAEQSERIFTGVKFAVERVNLTTRDGDRIEREKVVHPGAVLVLPITDDDRVVMIRNERFAVGEVLWELCAGTIEPGEPPQACAPRELIEETGYEAGSIEPLTTLYTSPGFCDERMHVFVARELKHVGQRLEPTEKIEVQLIAWPELLAMIERGEVRDGKTVAALLHYQVFKRTGARA